MDLKLLTFNNCRTVTGQHGGGGRTRGDRGDELCGWAGTCACADDINFLSKINSPLLTAVLSQVEARDADG